MEENQPVEVAGLTPAFPWDIMPDANSRKVRTTVSGYSQKEAKAGLSEKLPAIDTFPNQFAGYEIKIEVPEFTSLCPKTGLPDFGTLTVYYEPKARVLELKSLKEYFLAYRSLGIFYENVVNRVLKDVVKACRPIRAAVTGEFNPRGGLRSVIEARYPRPGKRSRAARG